LPRQGDTVAEPSSCDGVTAIFEDFSLEFKEVVHADEERVVTAVRDGGRIKGSDAEIWNDLFHVWTFRDGKILRVSSHNEKSRALKAAGLRE
jgi:ketosteroid isomerase-like protein